jgi:hypothetical protein
MDISVASNTATAEKKKKKEREERWAISSRK